MAKMTTGKCRLSYPHLSKPRTDEAGNNPKYSCTLLIPKDDKDTVKKLNDTIATAAEEFREKNGNASLPAKPNTTIHDGDGLRESGEEFGPECKGHYVITVSTKTAPLLIDRYKQDVEDIDGMFYPGCYVRAALNFKGYNFNGKKGITGYLNALQWVGEGEPLGGGRTTAADFDDGFDYGDSDEDFLA